MHICIIICVHGCRSCEGSRRDCAHATFNIIVAMYTLITDCSHAHSGVHVQRNYVHAHMIVSTLLHYVEARYTPEDAAYTLIVVVYT